MVNELGIKLDRAFKNNDFEFLRALLGNRPDFPNCRETGVGHLLEYALYHSSLSFIKKLLVAGANPNYEGNDGFPSIIAALSSERDEREDMIGLLLQYGADINQRGLNDWTPLHWAAAGNDVRLINYLLDQGADPTIRTRIDDKATPLEQAEILGCIEAVTAIKERTGEGS
ncbi:ankyrin repeat domain-containing protein [Balneolaceae bacterium YR4-1]|uniref:Ankyrin repeat domain-containing protein n=1 Tax=Halalkalibaculum roseum TaxID=2709311 RepID=A0A6M1T607_9BACT|nr:ankyrin repeat domain-containing protein [Halalkalibaculum roseum]NGP77425.1 ankyrin repeat domain-containing protein [Halalkalibaculum roseum]